MVKNYSGVFIQNREGKFLFQLRDNNVNAINPGVWGIFGGGIEPRENPKQALLRELEEEIELKLNPSKIKRLITIWLPRKKYYLYYVKLDKKITLKNLKEGAKLGYFYRKEMLKKKNLYFPMRIFLGLLPSIMKVSKVRN